MPENIPQSLSFRPHWNLDAAGLPIPVNQMLVRMGVPVGQSDPSGETYLTFGHLNPPAVIPNPETGEVQILGVENGEAPVTVVGHFAISRARLEEFREVLDNWLDANPPTEAGK